MKASATALDMLEKVIGQGTVPSSVYLKVSIHRDLRANKLILVDPVDFLLHTSRYRLAAKVSACSERPTETGSVN